MINNKGKKLTLQNERNPTYSGTEELIAIEQGLKKYSKYIVHQIAKAGKGKLNIKVLEFGAGRGQLAELFKDYFDIKPICIEIDPSCISILKNKGFKVFTSTKLVRTQFDLIYTSNVLEHIENDIEVLKNLNKLLAPNGVLVIYVPALPILFSNFDLKVGHVRRYNKNELMSKVKTAGFRIDDCFWNDSLGVILSIVVKLFGQKSSINIGNVKLLKFYDNVFFPISKVFDRVFFKRIIGKNLFVYATKLNK